MAKKNKGFLQRSSDGEDAEEEGSALEEQYMKMFPKMGRDFVHKDDLKAFVRELLFLLVQLNPSVLASGLSVDDYHAIIRAKEYQSLLEQNKLGTALYDDLIIMDE